MKRLLSLVFAAALSISAFGATLVPVQLLNPTGSVSGKTIVSTGPSGAPAWGGIGVNGIAAISANTVLANATGSSGSPTAFAMPSCSASGNSLNWTSGSGFTCATGYALLTGATFSGAITPSQTAGIVGTTTNNNANAGSWGEYVTATGTAVSLTTGTPTNVTSISLTAGDWDVTGNARFNAAGSTVTTAVACSASTTSATFPADPGVGAVFTPSTAGISPTTWAPTTRMSLASTTTVYFVCNAVFSTSTMTATGAIRARRVR